MRFVKRLISSFFTLLLLVFVFANTELITVTLLPSMMEVDIPLFVVFLFAFMVGAFLAYSFSLGKRLEYGKTHRQMQKELDRLKREVQESEDEPDGKH